MARSVRHCAVGAVRSLRTRVGLFVLLFTCFCFGGGGYFAHRDLSEALRDAELAHARATLAAIAVPVRISLQRGYSPADAVRELLDEFRDQPTTRLIQLSLIDRSRAQPQPEAKTRPEAKIQSEATTHHKAKAHPEEIHFNTNTFDATTPDITPLHETTMHSAILDTATLNTARPYAATPKTALFDVGFIEEARSRPGFHFSFAPVRDHPTYLDTSLPLDSERSMGTLLARFSLENSVRELKAVRRVMIPVTILAALASWLGALTLLNRLFLRPVRQLARMAHQLGDGALDVRTMIDRRDEIGELACSLNTMAAKLDEHTRGLQSAVAKRTMELENVNRELRRLANTDPLTGLRNRRFFEDSLEFELKRSERHPRSVVLCMFDIDHFKAFNDLLGHQAGDLVLREVAQMLAKNLRSTDILARYGGEEFVAILLDTARDEGLKTAEKLCRVVRETDFSAAGRPQGNRLTISVGVAAFPGDGSTSAALIRAADIALYAAKHRGRDQVVCFDPSIGAPDDEQDLPTATARRLTTSDVTLATPRPGWELERQR